MNRNLILGLLMVTVMIACTKDPEQPGNIGNKITVSTTAVTNITATGARSGGVGTTAGADSITMRGVCWALTTNPTTDNSKTMDGAGSGTYVSVITGLTTNKTYYIRAYVTSAAGTRYGGLRTFKTL